MKYERTSEGGASLVGDGIVIVVGEKALGRILDAWMGGVRENGKRMCQGPKEKKIKMCDVVAVLDSLSFG